MRAMLMNGDAAALAAPRLLTRSTIGASADRDEKWLQRLLFDHADLVPINSIDLHARSFIPVCRELSIPKDGAAVFLDLFGVTPTGRLVLIECKLWRNPQARREVIAQVLEYASLLRRWSYADLTVRLRAALRSTAANPLFELVRHRAPDIGEAEFVDAVSRSLASGDFILIVAGDGIRSDLQAMADHLNAASGVASRLALLEIQIWQDASGTTVLLPVVPFRTEVVQHRIIVDAGGKPVLLATGSEEAETGSPAILAGRGEQPERNRTFWQRFIDTVRFDHADQPPARHGGNNWVKLQLPAPAGGLTAYRSRGEIGLFLRLRSEGGHALFDRLAAAADELRAEIGADLTFEVRDQEPFNGLIAVKHAWGGAEMTDDDQLQWLGRTSNRMINAFRLRLALAE